MHSPRCPWLSKPIVLLTAVLLAASLPVQALSEVSITSPKPKTVLTGTAPVTAMPGVGIGFGYAMLIVDGNGRGITNAEPLRFELNTVSLPNGFHILQVSLCNEMGTIAVSPPVKVIVRNTSEEGPKAPLIPHPVRTKVQFAAAPAHPANVQPKPAPAQPVATAVAPKPKPAPAQPIAPTVVPKPQPIPPQPTVAAVSPKSVPMPPVAPVAAPPHKTPIGMPVMASDDHTSNLVVLLDGKPIEFHRAPYIDHDHAMVMLRTLVTTAGGVVEWDGKQAIVSVNQCAAIFVPDQSVATCGGESIKLDRPIVESNGRLFIPVTAWRTIFGGTVAYDEQLHCVTLRRETMDAPTIASIGK